MKCNGAEQLRNESARQPAGTLQRDAGESSLPDANVTVLPGDG